MGNKLDEYFERVIKKIEKNPGDINCDGILRSSDR
jgi:hypothetical protein